MYVRDSNSKNENIKVLNGLEKCIEKRQKRCHIHNHHRLSWIEGVCVVMAAGPDKRREYWLRFVVLASEPAGRGEV